MNYQSAVDFAAASGADEVAREAFALGRAHGALSVLADRLRGLAARCPRCAGTGLVRALFVAHTLTDDERALSRHYVDPARRARLRRNPTVDPTPRGAGVLSTPCRECHDLRQLIEIAEAAL